MISVVSQIASKIGSSQEYHVSNTKVFTHGDMDDTIFDGPLKILALTNQASFGELEFRFTGHQDPRI